jgi:hypothetical protein
MPSSAPATLKAQPKAKYRIAEYIGTYANKKAIRKLIIDTCKTSSVSLSQWESIKVGDARTISENTLRELAVLFGKPFTKMFNA